MLGGSRCQCQNPNMNKHLVFSILHLEENSHKPTLECCDVNDILGCTSQFYL